ncbi:VOC family protein [Haloarchaeobius amylolyticus]|uniref:VOC family protein n=1 Tax=Haloarchaeobius amylolyticus TaxID=1198296 RepID=UPI00226EEEEE|nr:VOC family protein [Haloarchaeobius amylolyticus]
MDPTDESCISMISHCSLIVADQEEALRFYTETLGFVKTEDVPMGEDRWLTVAPPGEYQTQLILRSPDWFGGIDQERYSELIGHNPMLGLEVSDCKGIYQTLLDRGVHFTTEPEESDRGIEAIFVDSEGNEILLFEEAAAE